MSHEPRLPRQEFLALFERYTYDVENGKVYNSDSKELGSLDTRPISGYVYICIGGRRFKRANLIWWKAKGNWPKQLLDHNDRNKVNDSISNLFEKTHRQNMENRSDQSVYGPGVTFNQGKFKAYTTINRKQIHIGRYNTSEEARQAHDKYLEGHL